MVDFNKLREKRKVRKETKSLNDEDFNALSSHDLKRLSVFWSEEEMGFFDMCNALRSIGECPVKGDGAGWGELFRWIGEMEQRELLLCDRQYNKATKRSDLESVVLSEKGADMVRYYADGFRPIIVEIESYSDKKWEENKSTILGDDEEIPF